MCACSTSAIGKYQKYNQATRFFLRKVGGISDSELKLSFKGTDDQLKNILHTMRMNERVSC